MIKYLKKLWKKYFRSLGDSRTKKEVEVVKPVSIPIPKPIHCKVHTRFKKSCPACLTAVGVK